MRKQAKPFAFSWPLLVAGIALFLAALMGLTAALFYQPPVESDTPTPSTVTVEDVVKATRSFALKKFVSFSAERENLQTGEKSIAYVDQRSYYSEQFGAATLYDGDFCTREENGSYTEILFPTEDQRRAALADFDQIFFDEELALKEIIKSRVLDGDRVLLTTEMTKSDSEAILKRDRYEAPRGVYFSIEYVLDAQTFRLLERVEKLHSFGSVQEYSRLTANYDADPPEGISRIRSHMIESELRTVIIITPSETGTVVVSGLARVGDRAEVVVPEGFALYSDPEGKIPFEKETDLRAANTTLYLFPQANKG